MTAGLIPLFCAKSHAETFSQALASRDWSKNEPLQVGPERVRATQHTEATTDQGVQALRVPSPTPSWPPTKKDR